MTLAIDLWLPHSCTHEDEFMPTHTPHHTKTNKQTNKTNLINLRAEIIWRERLLCKGLMEDTQ